MINIGFNRALLNVLLSLIIGYSFGGLYGLGIAASIALALRVIITYFHD